MKLTLTPLRLVLRRPLITAHGMISVREGVRVSIDGQGSGEAMPLSSFGTEPLEDTVAALSGWQSPGALDSIEAIAAATAPLHRTPAARHGLEVALLDRLARLQGVPLCRLLTSSPRRDVRCAALIDAEDAAGLADEAARAIDAGFEVLKIKVAVRPLAIEAQRLLAVRRRVGPRIRLRIDANGGWSESTARTALRGMESLELELCEQPVIARDIEALGRLRGRVPCQIAADEALLSPEGIERLFAKDRKPAADLLVLKSRRCSTA